VTEKKAFLRKQEVSGGGVRNGMAQVFNVFPDTACGVATRKQRTG